ncbi:expressed unknown protein [Seminavis robusta]|uniref:Uncharacterized protein n=1 Tax=Seminavis robusta TaxID=568900 RepID=A0A9N8DYC6_9STRA|nr:expressed unknown protein [Seminavis robusta]|eukprot:Sro375_g129450.1 n/a (98) ;mRNA; r:39568-39940
MQQDSSMTVHFKNGMAFTGMSTNIPGVGFELELQVPTPVVGPGVAVFVDLNPVWDLSVTLSVGAGVGSLLLHGFPETSTADTNNTILFLISLPVLYW